MPLLTKKPKSVVYDVGDMLYPSADFSLMNFTMRLTSKCTCEFVPYHRGTSSSTHAIPMLEDRANLMVVGFEDKPHDYQSGKLIAYVILSVHSGLVVSVLQDWVERNCAKELWKKP